MRTINKKIFLYELKKTFLLPTVFAAIVCTLLCIDTVFFGSNDAEGGADAVAQVCLYMFYALVMGVFIYRTFTTRKLYEKVGVRAETLFLIRMLYIFGYCFLFTTVLTVIGTLSFEFLNFEEYAWAQQVFKSTIFAYQNKSGWYFLFGASVGMTGAITYAAVVFMQHLIASGERWYLKIVWTVSFFSSILLAHAVISNSYLFAGLGSKEYFSTPIPYGAISYRNYGMFLSYMPNHPSLSLKLEPEILRFDLCWNITNIWVVLAGLLIIVFAYFAIGFLHRGKNDGYEVISQKEENK